MSAELWSQVDSYTSKVARRMTYKTNADMRDDFAQVARIRAWEVSQRFPDKRKNYIIRAAVNAMNDESRNEAVRYNLSLDALCAVTSWWVQPWYETHEQQTPSLQWHLSDMPIEIDLLARKLSSNEMQVLLAEYSNDCQADAAESLGLTVPAYKSRYHRAVRRARQLAGVC